MGSGGLGTVSSVTRNDEAGVLSQSSLGSELVSPVSPSVFTAVGF